MLRKIVGVTVAFAPAIAGLIVIGIKVAWWAPCVITAVVAILLAFLFVGQRIAGD